MQPIKFVKINDNLYDYDTMTLVNILSHRKGIIYFFIVEYEVNREGPKIVNKDLVQVPEIDYDKEIFLNYTIK